MGENGRVVRTTGGTRGSAPETHLQRFAVALLFLAQLFEAGRCDQHDVRLQVGGAQQFQALRMQIDDADFAAGGDRSDGLE